MATAIPAQTTKTTTGISSGAILPSKTEITNSVAPSSLAIEPSDQPIARTAMPYAIDLPPTKAASMSSAIVPLCLAAM